MAPPGPAVPVPGPYQPASAAIGPVLCSAHSDVHGPGRFTYAWGTFKTFRKAVAKLLTEEYDLRTAQEQLGHASQTTTETFYVGLNTEAPKVAETLEKFFKESTPSPKSG